MTILSKFGLFHTWKPFNALPSFPFQIHTQPKLMTSCMEAFTTLKKCLKYWFSKAWIYEATPTELFVDMKNGEKSIKVDHKSMLENLVPSNVIIK